MAGLGSIGRHPPLNGRGGKGLMMPHRPALATERVVHVGEAVAMIVAESALAAQDAAELVAVEYDALAPVTDARAALEPGAPQIWPEAPGNLAIDWPGPAADPEANARQVDAIFAAATFVARVAVTNQRMAVASIEPRGATASYDAAADSYTLRACTQGAGAVRDVLVAIMNVPKERLRVLTDDVGGAFGLKTGPYPEYVAQLIAAKKLKRAIHWMSGRSEAFLSDNQARDLYSEAARITGIDPVKLRRRNLIPAAAMPHKTAIGTTYDSGDFTPVLDKALALAGYDNFKARRRAAKSRGKYRGIGISCMLEHAGATPLEGAWLTFPGDGTLTVNLNVQSTGQGHASVFTRLVADRLGIGRDKITHKHGDSAREIAGYASVGSRSAMTAGAAIVKCVDVMLEKGKRIAAMLLEASEADIVYEAGSFGVVGSDRRIALFELAARAVEMKKQGAIAEDLGTKAATETPLTFPNGVHIAEVEIDPATGHMDIVAYTAVDDCGNVLDGMIVEGQLHGAVAQGLGQALMEQVVYDDSGQLVTGSFMDYAMPRAADMPPIRDALLCVPATTNPLGVKGVGEAGTTASIAAVTNAVADAIPGGAAAHLDMPASAARLWEACRRAQVDAPASGKT
jgi:CO/xanthine dehydrogenase Mo-binding subunit